MAPHGQFNTKSPTIKRILREANELSTTPSADYHACPLETNLFDWHFILRGPPAPSPYADGLYHGRIVLPPTYPLRPPSFRFLTPTGRFETNREICLSISGHHEETWQPAWGIRTALVALRSFMDQEAKGQVGGLDTTDDFRRRLAAESRSWRCAGCGGKTNEEVMKDVEADVAGYAQREGSNASMAGKEEKIPQELRLAYKDELGANNTEDSKASSAHASSAANNPIVGQPANQATTSAPTRQHAVARAGSPQPVNPLPRPTRTIQLPPHAHQMAAQHSNNGVPGWVDKAIGGVIACLVIMILKRLVGF